MVNDNVICAPKTTRETRDEIETRTRETELCFHDELINERELCLRSHARLPKEGVCDSRGVSQLSERDPGVSSRSLVGLTRLWGVRDGWDEVPSKL
jgi:hypothetical protein